MTSAVPLATAATIATAHNRLFALAALSLLRRQLLSIFQQAKAQVVYLQHFPAASPGPLGPTYRTCPAPAILPNATVPGAAKPSKKRHLSTSSPSARHVQVNRTILHMDAQTLQNGGQ